MLNIPQLPVVGASPLLGAFLDLQTPLTSFIDPACLAEFVASFLLILFGCGSCANAALAKTKGNSGGYFMVVTGWAMGIGLIVFLFGRASGAHTNPAITLTLALGGVFPWRLVVPYVIAQFLGCFLGAIAVYLAHFKHFQEPADPEAKLGVFCTIPGVRSLFWNGVTEFTGTAMLLFVITGLGFAARDGNEQLFDPGFSSLTVGILIFVIGISAGGPTGFALNPARDLAPRFAHAILPIAGKGKSDWVYSLVPLIAPLLGGPAGYFAWRLIFGNATLPALLGG